MITTGRYLLSLGIALALLFGTESALGAKYAGEAFTLGVGGRGLALGGAVVAGPFDGSAPYWNPAGMNLLGSRHFTAMHAETFGSLLNHDFIGYVDARSVGDTSRGFFDAIGFYLYYLGGDGIKITDLDQDDRPYVVREESHGDWLFSAALSRQIAPDIHVGIAGKIIYRDLGVESGWGLTADAGAVWRPCECTSFGLMISDITTGFIKYDRSTESIYPTVKPGVMFQYSYDDFIGRLTGSGDIKFENIKSGAQYWSGSLSLDTHFGGEIEWRGMLFGRAGFDIGRFTTGVGVLYRGLSFDFAYLDHDAFDETLRFSAGYQF
ncbi:MAG: PorV/PorQ family protein [Candidatus Zixiibacteriota bacterium]